MVINYMTKKINANDLVYVPSVSTIPPSKDTDYKYLNLVDGKLYKFAVLFNFVDGSTVP